MENHAYLKITDFSGAKHVSYPNALETVFCKIVYIAPEVVVHQPTYDVECDLWSAGVCLYYMLSATHPFYTLTGDPMDIERAILQGRYDFEDDEVWLDVSDEAKDLISSLLQVNPKRRLTSSQALCSKWLEPTLI
ncbi:hypothetical protein MPSEU_000370700 [Mayamaea pseudoterrestris]|nr:hypothetical protein MPSEU_000370700 [Mayamaea pseudoterrestris]